MAKYVDGYVIPVSKKKLPAYLKMAKLAGKVWREHGALEFRECVGEDLKVKGMTPFTKIAGCKAGETVMFSWIVYKSRAHRDRVNAAAMKDPRLAGMDMSTMPFDMKRMGWGGFEMKVEA